MKVPKWTRQFIKMTSFWKDNSLILRELRHFPLVVFFAILFPFLAAIFEGFGIGFLLGFLQNLIGSSGEPFQTGIGWFDVWVLGIEKSDLERLYRVSALILASTWIRACFNYLSEVYMRIGQARLIDRLYKQFFEQLQSLSLQFFSNVRSGEIINTLTAEINQLQQAIGTYSQIFSKGSTLIVYIAVALWISWPLCLLMMALLGLTAVGLSSLRKKVREASFPVSAARGQFTSLATELISGIRTVQAFATYDYERKRYYKASSEIVDKFTAAAKQMAVIRPVTEGIATTIVIAIIILAMTVFVPSGALNTASLLTFLFVIFRLIPSIPILSTLFAQLNSFQGSINNIQELLRRDNKPYIKNGNLRFSGINQTIKITNIDFGYDSNALILKDITLTIEKGTTVALVGSSGAGKSTLADLIPRFYDPTSGQILFDNVDLREFDISSVRHKMAIVSQDTFIFNATVRENIAYGTEGATDSEIYDAAQLANATEFIQDMPEGFETILGDRGVRLSGGQRQRIAIARALIKNPEILILDEATSALDSVSEKLIQESLEKLSVGRTVITIAHRLSTISNADHIVVIENGRIMEEGKYYDLITRKGKLWDYHKVQKGISA